MADLYDHGSFAGKCRNGRTPPSRRGGRRGGDDDDETDVEDDADAIDVVDLEAVRHSRQLHEPLGVVFLIGVTMAVGGRSEMDDTDELAE